MEEREKGVKEKGDFFTIFPSFPFRVPISLITLTTLTPFLITFFLLLAGCKTSTKVGTVAVVDAKAHHEFFDSMQKQAFQYETFSARTNVDLNISGKSFSSRVDIKMISDSALQLSVQPLLGIELFRAEFTLEGLTIIDRMNKRYVSESYAALKGKLPVAFNYYNLQALFSNHIFIPGEQNILQQQYNRFKLKQEGSTAEIRIKDAMQLLYIFMADGEEKLLSTYVTDKSEQYALQWLYADFRMTDGQPFPMLMDVQLFDNGSSAGQMKIYFSKIQTNAPVKIDTSIPDKYKRVTVAQIVKGLTDSKM
ncbi:MAG: DUF4292 domain-containing protein [Tannerellaceae bacterium]|jgi:hypothetical protein|nr:DUF4292 domain-containing protein [Tannerellaceae bacterium]